MGWFRRHFDARNIERALFAMVIVLLMLVTMRSQRQQENALDKATLLESEVENQTQQMERLQEDFFRTRYDLAKLQQGLLSNTTTGNRSAPNESAEDKAPLQASWSVTGRTMMPPEYNSDTITELQRKIDELELKAATDEGTDVRDETRLLRRQQSDLSEGEPKYELDSINVTITNPRANPASLSYSLCWVELDCRIVVMKGNINASSGTSSYELPVELPRVLAIEKTKLTLRMLLEEGDEVVLSDDYVIISPELTQ